MATLLARIRGVPSSNLDKETGSLFISNSKARLYETGSYFLTRMGTQGAYKMRYIT
jgi:hypothetical protein